MAFKIPEEILKGMLWFVVRQLGKYLESADFEKIRADLEIRLRDLIPGTMFDDAVISLMDIVIATIKKLMEAPMEAKNILEHLKSGDITYAYNSFLEAVKGK